MPVAKEPARAPECEALLIPEWVPEQVADKARERHKLLSDSPVAVALIRRLLTDPQMKVVWDELRKQGRNPDDHYRPTGPRYKVANTFKAIGIDERKAAAGLFEFAVNLGRLTLDFAPSSVGTDTFSKKADALRTDAKQAEKIRPRRVGQQYAERLRKAAEVYDNVRYKPHNEIEAVALQIALRLAMVFESPMLNAAAIITSVIMKQQVTPSMVRNWVRRFKSETHYN
jgi:hypothetical protein